MSTFHFTKSSHNELTSDFLTYALLTTIIILSFLKNEMRFWKSLKNELIIVYLKILFYINTLNNFKVSDKDKLQF